MLQNLREHAQGWVAGVIVAVFCIAFSLWGIEYYLENNNANNTAVKVNGEAITNQQLDTAVQRVRQELLQTNPSINLDQDALKVLRARTLDELINRQVLSDAATKAGYRINSDQLDSVILQVPAFQVNGQFSPELFQRVLANLMYTQQDFMQNLKRNMLIVQAQSSITEGEFGLDTEVDEVIKLLQQKRSFAYTIIPAKKDSKQTSISDQAVQSYYQAHEKEFMLPEKVSVAYIILSAKDLAQQADIQPTEAEIAQYYQTNQQQFTHPPQWQVARILLPIAADTQSVVKNKQLAESIAKQAQAGSDFAQLAKKYSSDKATAAKGGIMPWLTRNQKNAALIQDLAKLQPGQVTIIDTPEGINIVKLIATKAAAVQPLNEAKTQIAQLMKQQRLEQVFNEKSDQLSNLTFTNPDTLEPAAQTLGLPIKTTELFTKEGLKTGIAANPKVIAAAFSDTVLKQGSNSDIIQVDPETLVVLRMKDHRPAQLQPLAEVKADIQQGLMVQEAQEKAQKTGQAIINELQSGKSVTDLAKRYDVSWQNANNVSRQTSTMNPQLLSTAFAIPKPNTDKTPSIAGAQLSNGDFVVIVLNQVVNGDPNLFSQQEKTALRQNIATNYSQLENQLYAEEQIKKARIKMKKQDNT